MAELITDFLTRPIPQVPHLIGRGILPKAGRLIIGGPPKTNKSWVALSIALSLARGQDIFNAHYKSGVPVLPVQEAYRVLYIEQEIGPVTLQDRLRGLTADENLAGVELYVKSKDLQMRLDDKEGFELICREVATVRPHCLILDPMAKFHTAEENSSQDMGIVLMNCATITTAYETALILVHHVAKQNAEYPRRGGDRLRGSSAIFADVDTCCIVERISSETAQEPVLELDFELRCGAPVEKLYVKRLSDGRVEYMGTDFSPPRPPQSARKSRGGVYRAGS